jgi:preprotein translocase subunit SecA
MSGLAFPIPAPPRHSPPRDPGSTRLWPALTWPGQRRRPTRGVDVLGERLLGWAARARRSRLQWGRARVILDLARGLRDASDAELDRRIAHARERVLINRDDPHAVHAAFAVAHEAIRRTIGLDLYPEQVLGALAMADGCCAELATGEGKTVTAILPAALDAWLGKGVHVVTVNDYLARRDAEWCGPAYRRLGLSVGYILDSSTHPERRHAYDADVTYAADKQVIFDFLRDRLITPLRPRLAGVLLDGLFGPSRPDDPRVHPDWSRLVVQRGLFSAIVDEADSVLIDEAVTPAIIAEHDEHPHAAAEHYRLAADLARQMTPGEHFTVDERMRLVRLTDAGRSWLARRAGGLPPFWAGPRRREELITTALTARVIYARGDDYIVQDGKVVIVDRSTGRVLPGRQWQLGLHQAIEAKEGLPITHDRITSSRISYQRFFQKYRRLAGMTGTAAEVRAELWRWYRLPVVRVPTHRPVIRVHAPQRVFDTQDEKFQAVARRVEQHHAQGRPVLVGTRSVAASERLSAMLTERGVPHEVLNATREAHEAAIVARAGRLGAVTVATNMAGRGTDIVLDERSRALGGLVVIATERHDERRVDRQLYGRSGRQGDPGLAETCVALDDPLIRRHGLAPLRWLTRRLRGPARHVCARWLWSMAQHAAARRWSAARAAAAQVEDWTELALHRHSR